ncbi:MAG: hypothetical protein JNM70_00905 [Anaerolineae bacterium]|nr:hypothetical protein [Anaerolineae bacterium]
MIADYQDVYIHSRYGEHARGILSLITRIRDDIVLADVVPGTSLAALFLEIPGKRKRVFVWCEIPDERYVVYLYHPDVGESGRVTVDNREIVQTIKNYVEKVRRD